MNRRTLPALLAGLLAMTLSACDHPKEEDCKRAIQNIDRISGRTPDPEDEAAAIRRCRGGASGASVRCWAAAKTLEDLAACEGGPSLPPAPR